MERYHEFGRALRRLMRDENVLADSQEELAKKLKDAGYDYSQQILSDYARNREVDGVVRARVIPRAEFFTALDNAFSLTDEQWTELTKGWLAIQPDDMQEGYRRMGTFLAKLR